MVEEKVVLIENHFRLAIRYHLTGGERLIPVDRSKNVPVHRQVYEALRDQILRGELSPGHRLPSTRSLAAALNLSRNVTVLAYEQLQADGLIDSHHGSGAFVAGMWAADAHVTSSKPTVDRSSAPSPTSTAPTDSRLLCDFRSGLPDCEAFPRTIWARLWHNAIREMTPSAFGYGPVAGLPALREALASHLAHTRGVRTAPANIVITSGATQALSVLATTLLKPGDLVVCENPSHNVIRSIYQRLGARILPIPVDEKGMQVERLAQAGVRPKLIYVTPSHQFPTGAVLRTERRQALVNLARATGALIVEDDYDSETRHSGPPLPALQGLAPDQVIYVGSFSKILVPTLRVGYAALPCHLTEAFCSAKFMADYHSPGIEQRALATFITEGHLQRHLARMRRLYRSKRAALIAALAEHFPGRLLCRGDETGLHLWIELDSPWSGADLARAAANRGVGVYPLDDYWSPSIPTPDGCHLILGYGGLSPRTMQQGIAVLADVERMGPPVR